MGSSAIKHRKGGKGKVTGINQTTGTNQTSSPKSSAGSDSDAESSNHGSKYDRSNRSSPFKTIFLLMIFATQIALFNYVRLTRQGKTHRLTVRGNKKHSPRPFSTLIAEEEKDKAFARGEIPITGLYTLGKEHLLQFGERIDQIPEEGILAGSIQFPSVDLSDDDEEQQNLRNPSSESFLTSTSFKSTVNQYSHRARSLVPSELALLTRKGQKQGDIPNQDRSFIANFFVDVNQGQTTSHARQIKMQTNGNGRPSALLLGIFDGHGNRGHEVSHFIAIEFTRLFASIMRETQERHGPFFQFLGSQKQEHHSIDYVRTVLTETFLTLDQNEPVQGTGGSTASVLFYPGLDSKVYVANAGDSTTIIAKYSKHTNKSQIIYQNKKHKPHLKEERERIERAGGHVMIPPDMQGDISPGLKESSRIIIPDKTGNPMGGLALAMSRSIGDADGKPVGLTAEPDVDVWDLISIPRKKLADNQFFAVVASDGLYDMISPDAVVEYLGRSLYGRGIKNNVSPMEACERLIREASRLWAQSSNGGMMYRDDITIGVSNLNFALV